MSDPERLLQFAKEQKDDAIKNIDDTISFDKDIDKMVVVFDADVFECKKSNYAQILEFAEANHLTLAVTNPSFELFLLLHHEDA